MRGGDPSQGGVGIHRDNGSDHFRNQISSKERTEMLKPGKNQQPPIQNVTDSIIAEQNYDSNDS